MLHSQICRTLQIAKDDVVVKGRLVFKLNEGNTVNPRWLVSFDDDPSWKDEEVYEKSFLKLVTVDTENPGTAGKPQAPRRTKAARSKKSQKSSGSSTKGSSSSEAEESRGSARLTTNKRKVVTGSETSPAVSEIDSPVSKDEKNKMSAREQRSLRRQAKMKEDEPMIQPKVLAGTKRVRNLPAPNSKLSGSTSSQMGPAAKSPNAQS